MSKDRDPQHALHSHGVGMTEYGELLGEQRSWTKKN
jgi:hypothetical protein